MHEKIIEKIIHYPVEERIFICPGEVRLFNCQRLHLLAKFIIIDNSIEDTVGHHFQYAAHCLKAASDLGHDAVLATNKSYSSPEASEWKTFPVYSYGFWDTHGSTLGKSLVNLNRSFSTKTNQLKYKAIFSWIGYSWENRNQLLSQTSLPGEAGMKNPIPWIILSSIIVPLFMLSVRINNRLHKTKGKILNLSSRRQRDPITGTLIEEKRSNVFFKDTRTLFDRIKLEKDDIVFVPTVGITELLGFLEYFRKEPDSKLATWHMLFRRNIYTGRDTEYWRQDENLRILRNTLLHFTQSLQEHRVFFYTDTDELTAQYNRLGISPFNTLPVPHTMPASEQKAGGVRSALIVTYIGDARTEKGYHLLPHIVNDLWSDYAMSGRVRFVFQSNFNMPKGEPKIVVARSDLESLPREKVELIYNALSFEEYKKLLLETNIMLLPYEADNYYARSSGILVECLAAGIPVVVPSATWLSRQFIREVYRHQESLHKAMKATEYFSDSEILWKRNNSEVSPFVNGELIFGGESTKAYCWLERPISSTHLYVSFAINAPIRSCVRVDLAQLRNDKTTTKFISQVIENLSDDEESNKTTTTTTTTFTTSTSTSTSTPSHSSSDLYSVLVPLESDCYKIWLGFKNAFGNKAIKLIRINVAFQEPGENSSKLFPKGAVGLAYDNPYEISGLLRDIIDNYPHYRRTALAFSREYLKVHNAGHLVEEIKGNTNSVL
jgi:hypothetical protein